MSKLTSKLSKQSKTNSENKWAKRVEDNFWSVEIKPYNLETYTHKMSQRQSGNYNITHVAVEPHRLLRNHGHIQMSEIADLLLIYMRKGKCTVQHNGDQVSLSESNFCVVNGWEPYELDFQKAAEMIVFRMPVTALEARSKVRTNKIAFKEIETSTGLAKIALSALEAAFDQLEMIPKNQDRILFNNLASLLCASLQSTSKVDESEDDSSYYYEELIRRIRRYVEDNIENETLNAETIANAHGISVRYLNKIFETEHDTAVKYIRSLRLRLFAQRFISDTGNLTIKEIVFGCGFSDYAHFHRAFKQYFQCTPNEYRNRNQRNAISET